MPYCISDLILPYSGYQFVSRLFVSLYTLHRSEKWTTTAFLLQTNGQVERYNKRYVSRHWLYTIDNQQNWYMFVPSLAYAYNCQEHRSTNETPYSLTLIRQLFEQTTVVSSSTLPDDATNATNSKFLRQKILLKVAAMQDRVSKF